jgi:signal transduction histidine kinase
MKTAHIRTFLTSQTGRLAGTYLAIIMVMSLGFSYVFYHTSSSELGRQLPPDAIYSTTRGAGPGQGDAMGGVIGFTRSVSSDQLTQFLQTRIDEGRHALLVRLVWVNIGALAVGGVLSYLLARRSLKPIEDAMEAQAQFVSDASHELRTPLTAIQTSNEVFLRRQKATVTQARDLIEQNTDDVKRLKELSDGLLNLAQHKQSEPKMVPLSLQDLVSEALTKVVPQATAKNIAVHDETGDTDILGDKTALTQLLVILLDNAIKYSNRGKNVYLSSEVHGKYVYIEMRDEGIGIRASDLPHLFRRFYRADNARVSGERSGYGLGLAIAQQIAQGHRGDITAASILGQGSTFTVKLLAAPAVEQS